jgi:negative regulator of sigma E activity
MAKAEKRNNKAIKRVKKAKKGVDKSQFQYRKTQAEILIQLTRLDGVEKEIAQKAVAQDRKIKKIDALLESIDE